MDYGWAAGLVCAGFVIGVSVSLGLMVLGAMFAFMKMAREEPAIISKFANDLDARRADEQG